MILDVYEKKQLFYLYIGRGLLLEVMYMGYFILFIFIKYEIVCLIIIKKNI